MVKKGQVEIIALFGVIFLVVAVIFYAYQSGSFGTSPVPTGVAEKQKTITNSINNFIRLGAMEILANASMYGGYVYETDFSSDARFNGRPVPFWQSGGVLRIPTTTESDVMSGITEYIRENIGFLMDEIGMDNVTVDASALSVSGNIMNDGVFL
jgi:hypothetical protein